MHSLPNAAKRQTRGFSEKGQDVPSASVTGTVSRVWQTHLPCPPFARPSPSAHTTNPVLICCAFCRQSANPISPAHRGGTLPLTLCRRRLQQPRLPPRGRACGEAPAGQDHLDPPALPDLGPGRLPGRRDRFLPPRPQGRPRGDRRSPRDGHAATAQARRRLHAGRFPAALSSVPSPPAASPSSASIPVPSPTTGPLLPFSCGVGGVVSGQRPLTQTNSMRAAKSRQGKSGFYAVISACGGR